MPGRSGDYLPHRWLHAQALQAQLPAQVQRSPSLQRQGITFWLWGLFVCFVLVMGISGSKHAPVRAFVSKTHEVGEHYTGLMIGRVVALWLALAMPACLADALLLHPPSPSESKHRQQRRMLNDRDGALEVFVANSQPGNAPTAYMLCFFGNGQLADEPVVNLARALPNISIELWGVNYPGYGQSEGDATLDGVARAARVAYDAIAHTADGKPIIVFGSSLGATAALHLAARERLAGVVLLNPPPLRSLILRRYGWWNLWLIALPTALQIPAELDASANAARSRAPAVFISSSDDGVVPMSYQECVMHHYAGDWTLFEMRGAGHNDPMQRWIRDALQRTLATWIAV